MNVTLSLETKVTCTSFVFFRDSPWLWKSTSGVTLVENAVAYTNYLSFSSFAADVILTLMVFIT